VLVVASHASAAPLGSAFACGKLSAHTSSAICYDTPSTSQTSITLIDNSFGTGAHTHDDGQLGRTDLQFSLESVGGIGNGLVLRPRTSALGIGASLADDADTPSNSIGTQTSSTATLPAAAIMLTLATMLAFGAQAWRRLNGLPDAALDRSALDDPRKAKAPPTSIAPACAAAHRTIALTPLRI
jgi:hypothetical protein